MKLNMSLILMFCSVALMAYSDPLAAVKNIELAIEKIGVWEDDKVDECAQKGFDAMGREDLANWMLWHQRLGSAWRKYGDHQKALDWYKKGLDGMWKAPENEEEYERLGWLYADIGYTYYRELNELYIGRDYYKKSTSIFSDTLGLENNIIARYIFKPLGNIYSGLRDIENSTYYHKKAKSIFMDSQMWDEFGSSCYNLALMYNGVQDFLQADAALTEGLKKLDSISPKKKMLLHTMAGKNFADREMYKEAREHTDKAKKLLDISAHEFSDYDLYAYRYEIYYNYGLISRGEKKFEDAEKFYLKALNIQNNKLSGRRESAVLYQQIGGLYQDWNKPEKAEEYYQKSLDYLSPVISTINDPDLIFDKVLIPEPLLSFAFEGLAVACMGKYKINHDLKELEKAVQNLNFSNEVGRLLLQNYATEGSRLNALKKQRGLKELSLDAAYQYWQIDPTEIWEEKMFNICESSKAFLQLETARLSKSAENWEDGQRLTYDSLRTRLAHLETSIYDLKAKGTKIGNQELDTHTEDYLKTNEAIAKIRNEEFEKEQKNMGGNYSGIISIKKLQEGLADNQVIVAYFLGEKSLFIFRITQDGFLPIKKELPADFQLNIDSLREALTAASNPEKTNYFSLFTTYSFQLYDHLLKEILSGLSPEKNRLTIISDGRLGFIPFEALVSRPPRQATNFSELHYLINDFAITYATSASLLHNQKERASQRANKLFAGFAPSYDSKIITPPDTSGQPLYAMIVRTGNFTLPGAEAEVTAIHNILGGDKFMGHEASELEFKEKAADYQILLLSMHSLVNVDNPDFTKLLFTKGASGGEEDDLLNSLELYSLPLHADLVVLSACNTGFGKLQPGEGVMSLSRSFFTAGVPSSVMSLWKVPDAQTKLIMVNFFSNLQKGMTKDEALRQAKLDFLKEADSKSTNPYFWAGFVVAGNPEPLNIMVQNNFPYRWIFAGIILLTASFFFFRHKRSSN